MQQREMGRQAVERKRLGKGGKTTSLKPFDLGSYWGHLEGTSQPPSPNTTPSVRAHRSGRPLDPSHARSTPPFPGRADSWIKPTDCDHPPIIRETRWFGGKTDL